MGIARRKKLADEPTPTGRKPPTKTQRGRRGWLPVTLAYEPVGIPAIDELGPDNRRFMAVRDGTVYELLEVPGKHRIKVTDDVVIGRVHKTLGISSSERLK